MENVRTIVTTIVSIKAPRKQDLLLSEKLLSQLDDDYDDRKLIKVREGLASKLGCLSIGKLVSNPIRDQDNLLLELVLPADFDQETESAARILAPFLIVSNHMIFNFDNCDFKDSIQGCVRLLIESVRMADFNELRDSEMEN